MATPEFDISRNNVSVRCKLSKIYLGARLSPRRVIKALPSVPPIPVIGQSVLQAQTSNDTEETSAVPNRMPKS